MPTCLKELKDNQGEPAEYEECFSRVLAETTDQGLSEKHALHAQLLLLLQDSARSSTVVEQSLKLVHLLGVDIVLPAQIAHVIDKDTILHVYSLHVLERKTQFLPHGGDIWTELIDQLLSATLVHPHAFLVLTSYLCQYLPVREVVIEFLDSATNWCTSLRLAGELLLTEWSEIALDRVEQYSALIGHHDGFVSREASLFCLRVKSARPDYQLDLGQPPGQRPASMDIDSLGHFLRDGLVHFTPDQQQTIARSLSLDQQLLPTVRQFFPEINFAHTDIPNKIKRSLLTEPLVAVDEPLPLIQLRQLYSPTKSLVHLFQVSCGHVGCFEI